MMKYLIVDVRYLHQYGLQRALRFCSIADSFEDALLIANKNLNWYDHQIITIEEKDLKSIEYFRG